jgi:hypothetical protein
MSAPPARSQELLVERVGDEAVIYDPKTKQAHCLKPFAALVFDCCDGDTTVRQIAAAATERLGETVTENEVTEALTQLEDRGLLDAPLVIHQNGARAESNGLSRREVVRRTAFAGVASAVAGSLVTTIGTSPAFALGSQLASGCSGCGQNKDCVSNHCCQQVAGKQCNQTCCVDQDNSCHISGPTGSTVCTVVLASGTCPCICGAPGCTSGPCCPPKPPGQQSVCCTPTCPGGTCAGGLTCCSGFCFDLQNDPNACGSCTNTCNGTQTCTNGVCV